MDPPFIPSDRCMGWSRGTYMPPLKCHPQLRTRDKYRGFGGSRRTTHSSAPSSFPRHLTQIKTWAEELGKRLKPGRERVPCPPWVFHLCFKNAEPTGIHRTGPLLRLMVRSYDQCTTVVLILGAPRLWLTNCTETPYPPTFEVEFANSNLSLNDKSTHPTLQGVIPGSHCGSRKKELRPDKLAIGRMIKGSPQDGKSSKCETRQTYHWEDEGIPSGWQIHQTATTYISHWTRGWRRSIPHDVRSNNWPQAKLALSCHPALQIENTGLSQLSLIKMLAKQLIMFVKLRSP